MDNIKRFIISISIFALAGCATQSVPRPVSLGAGGAAAGAGAGALVGALISNGDIGLSAALGAGIGAATGIMVGYVVDEMERAEVRRIDQTIRSNQTEINLRQQELDKLHQRAMDSSQRGQPDESLRERIYDGPTLGNSYR